MLSDPLSMSIPLQDGRPKKPVYPQRKLLVPSPEHPDDYVLEIDYSNASEITRCARAAENVLVHAREANRPESATGFGDLFHRCEALRLEHGLDATIEVEDVLPLGGTMKRMVSIPDRQRELVAEYFLYNPPRPDDHRTAARMVDVLDEYNRRYKDDGWTNKVYKDETRMYVEVPFKIGLTTIAVNAPLPYPRQLVIKDSHDDTDRNAWPVVRNIHVIYTGKIDLVMHDSNLLWVTDHKTSSRGGDEFWSAFNLSLQTRGYAYAAQKVTGHKIAGLIVNALIIRPLTKTGKGTEFDRRSFFYSEDSYTEFEWNMKALVTDFVAMLVRGYFPQYARSFKSPCQGCGYHENCRLPVSQRAADLASDLYRDVTWNPMH